MSVCLCMLVSVCVCVVCGCGCGCVSACACVVDKGVQHGMAMDAGRRRGRTQGPGVMEVSRVVTHNRFNFEHVTREHVSRALCMRKLLQGE